MDDRKVEPMAEDLAKRRVPCLATYLHPFRVIDGPTSADWNVSVEQINSGAWDYVALQEIVGGIDVGLISPYHLVVCRDGGLALPPIDELRHERKAVEFFNRCLAAILVGGIYCEAITLDGLDFGSILDWKYVRVSTQSSAAPNRFHNLIRLQSASPIEAIALEAPRKLKLADLSGASDIGRRVLGEIPEVDGEYLLRGTTAYARRDWSAALANLWIVIEQMTSHVWERKVVDEAKASTSVAGRIDSLTDNRTWTVGVRQEVLFQRGFLTPSLVSNLNRARKARNRLSHTGTPPGEEAATSALNSVREYLGIIVPNVDIPFAKINLADHGLSDPFRPMDRVPTEPKYWMEIKKLPGEAELEQLEAKHLRSR